MSKRTCSECVYAIQPTKQQRFTATMARWVCPLTCLNHADCPGVLWDTWPANTCRNFRAKGERQTRTAPPEPPNDEVRYITLTQGKYAIVDAADYEWLSRYRWYTMRGSRGICYAATRIDGKNVLMHRLIMNPPKGKVVDHIDCNGLNDRHSNLRICTPRENARNRRGGKGKTSQFLGVYRRKDTPDKWFARVACGDKKVYLGPFDDEAEAARARDRAAIELHGEFASLNFREEADPQATDRTITRAPE